MQPLQHLTIALLILTLGVALGLQQHQERQRRAAEERLYAQAQQLDRVQQALLREVGRYSDDLDLLEALGLSVGPEVSLQLESQGAEHRLGYRAELEDLRSGTVCVLQGRRGLTPRFSCA